MKTMTGTETTYHYDGTVKLEFDPQWHTYRINGTKVDGVTTALQILAKPALIMWAAKKAGEHIEENLKPGQSLDEMEIADLIRGAVNAHRQKKDHAAEMGTKIHDWIERFVGGQNPTMPINSQMKKAVQAFLGWYERVDCQPIQTEQKLCSPTLRLAGTADLVCTLDGKTTILDWKTGSGIYPEMFLQLGAYARMYEEEFGKKIEQVGIVNCSAKAPFKTKIMTDVMRFNQTYESVLELSRTLKQLEESFNEK